MEQIRTQTGKLDEIRIKPLNIACGVPQGTILSPLIFMIYINDMLELSHNDKIIAHADSTVFVHE